MVGFFQTEINLFPNAVFVFLIALINGFIVYNVYRKTYEGVLFSPGFCTSILLLPVIIALIIITISDNLALSLGMIGALSIVRYRTPIKEPLDLFFIFWALSVGIASGAGYSLISLFVSCLIGSLLIIRKVNMVKKIGVKLGISDVDNINNYLLIISFTGSVAEKLKCNTFLEAITMFSEKLVLKSKIVERSFCELIVAVKLKPGKEQELLTMVETQWNGQAKLLFPANDTIAE